MGRHSFVDRKPISYSTFYCTYFTSYQVSVLEWPTKRRQESEDYGVSRILTRSRMRRPIDNTLYFNTFSSTLYFQQTAITHCTVFEITQQPTTRLIRIRYRKIRRSAGYNNFNSDIGGSRATDRYLGISVFPFFFQKDFEIFSCQPLVKARKILPHHRSESPEW